MSEPTDVELRKLPIARVRLSIVILRALSFAVGFLLAIASCSLLGWQVSERNIFRGFDRFHTRLSPESFFQPTAREVHALAKDLLDRSRTNVIVGGDSVFYGVGQPQGQTLADNLRRELGSEYRVINLAMRGGDISGIAEITAEMLTREQYHVVYVSNIGVAAVPQAIGSVPYQYFYWDAKARNLLIDWPARDSKFNRSWYDESVLSASLDKLFYFVELWNAIGYNYVFTVYSRLIPGTFWQPRKNLPDNEIDPPDALRYLNVELELGLIARSAQLPTELLWQNVKTAIDVAVPYSIRRSTVLAICENSPWLLDQSNAEVRANRKSMREAMLTRINEAGATGLISCDGFEKSDYIDRVHLSIYGALKIAPRLATKVREVSQKNGWAQ
jgi:hypothetical protein